jgi:hypothetical protein
MIEANQSGSYQSSILMADHYLPPDDAENEYLLDMESGPIALNDPTEGLFYQAWTLRYYGETGDFTLSAPNTAETIVLNAANVTEISLAFDQNGNPFIAFVEDDVAKFFWFDPVIPGDTVTNLPANSLTPRCCTDDKLETAAAANRSDVILCYVNSGALKMRKERDRYTIEEIIESDFVHPVTGNPALLKRVGMNEIRRLQWTCTDSLRRGGCT